jgi:signal transduction histidine kinase
MAGELMSKGQTFRPFRDQRLMLTLLATLILMASAVSDAMAYPKQVLVINSFGHQFRPWSEYTRTIRTEIAHHAPWPVDITSYPLVTARSDNPNAERLFVDYLREYYRPRPPDLIVAIGAAAVTFAQHHRQELFATAPLLFAAVDQRFVQQSTLTANDAAVAVNIAVPPLFENILRVLPATEMVAVVSGNSPTEQLWLTQMRKDLKPLAERTKIVYWDGLSFEDMLKRAAALPRNSAVFWTQLRVDADGVVHEGEQPLQQLYAVTSAPIFSYDDTFFKGETVGGPMLSMTDISRTTANVAIRLLAGEKPAAIDTAPIGYSPPRYDWRQLQRWGISESNLPAGSEVLFREPTFLAQYPEQIALVGAAFIIQAALISGLLYERRLRRGAEAESRERLTELAHINRRATAGELCSSIAHELNQPLAAILTNAETAELMLKTESPDLKEITQILDDIRRDDHRASDVLLRLRQLLKKQPFRPTLLNLNETIAQALEISCAIAQQRRIEIKREFASTAVYVQGDAVQLQQVILNLIINAIDATPDNGAAHQIVVRTGSNGKFADISISDCGLGIAPELSGKIFDPFFSTKQDGMGIGLSIARTIISGHGGQIWADADQASGATFRIRLPLA